MSDLLLFAGCFAGSGLLMLMGWWKIGRAVAAENAIVFEEWER